MRSPPAQQGFLLIAAVVLIVVLGFFAVVISYLFVGNTAGSGDHLSSAKALFLAESGIERVGRHLLAPTLTARVACGAIPAGNTVLNATSGEFSLAIQAGSPVYMSTAPTLSAAMAAGTASPINFLQISNAAALDARGGRVMIEREVFDYASTGTTVATCGGGAFSNCLRGVVRARDGTIATPHAAGARIGQYQCSVISNGGAPNLTNPAARRILNVGIQLQEGWAVGDNGVILRWNGPGSETTWSLFATTTINLLAVSMDSYANGWTVGTLTGGVAQIRRWNPDGTPAWDLVGYPAITNNAQLNAVHVLNNNEAWAVGNDRAGGNDTMVMHWDGTNWIYVDPAGNFDQILRGVFILDTNNDGVADDGWAVGNGGNIRRGMTWAAFASPTGQQLNSVFMSSNTDGWIVGNRTGAGTNQWVMARFNGAAWNLVATTTGIAAQNLNSVFCVSVTDCWAVGNRRGCINPGPTILHWNGTAWTCPAAAILPAAADQNLNSVTCIHANDCWAVGNAGTIVHWDGNSWINHPQSGVVTAQNLRGISMIGPRQLGRSDWTEFFP